MSSLDYLRGDVEYEPIKKNCFRYKFLEEWKKMEEEWQKKKII